MYADNDADNSSSLLPSSNEGSNDITTEKATQMIEKLALTAEKSAEKGSVEDTDVYYDSMAQILEDIIYSVKVKTNAYQFLKSKGLSRVISTNLGTDHPEMRTKLLILLNTLFEVAPVTTNALIPKGIVSRLLDIFENDPNLAHKARVLDVLNKWLPNNPEIQVRVMKLKGLEPFYTHINLLDISVIQTLLELFNTILKEHIEARSEKAQVTKRDHDRQVLYQKIGLLERMETSNVCNGLVNIFQVVWPYNTNGELVKVLLELMEKSKRFCGEILKGKTKALALFEAVLKFLKNVEKQSYFDEIGLDATKFVSVLEDYVAKVRTERDEF